MKKVTSMIWIMMIMATLVACDSYSEETRATPKLDDTISEEQEDLTYNEESQNAENNENGNTENEITMEEEYSYYVPGNFPSTVTPYDFHEFGDMAVALQMEYEKRFFFCDGNAKPIDNLKRVEILSFPAGDGILTHNGIKSYNEDGYVLSMTSQNGFSIISNNSFNMSLNTWNGVTPLYQIGQYDSRYGIIPLSSSTYASNINLIPCSVIDWSTLEEYTSNGVTGYVFELKR